MNQGMPHSPVIVSLPTSAGSMSACPSPVISESKFLLNILNLLLFIGKEIQNKCSLKNAIEDTTPPNISSDFIAC